MIDRRLKKKKENHNNIIKYYYRSIHLFLHSIISIIN